MTVGRDSQATELSAQTVRYPDGYKQIKKIISEIEASTPNTKKSRVKNFLEQIIRNYDQANGKLSLKKCLTLAKWQNPVDFELVDPMVLIPCLLSENSNYDLVQGPRNKNRATIELEKLIHLLLSDYKSIRCQYNAANELEIYVDNHFFNITQIFNHHVNLDQISLTTSQLDRYVEFITKKAHYVPEINDVLPSPETYESTDRYSECAHLHYGEKLAITLYTTDIYEEMQLFLRQGENANTFQTLPNFLLRKSIPELLLATVVASHGLAKPTTVTALPIGTTKKLYRSESAQPNDEYIKKRIQAVKTGKPIFEKGLTSTTKECEIVNPNPLKSPNVFVTYFDEEGFNSLGKNTQPLSAHPDENETTYLSGQFQYTDYMEHKGQLFFAAKPVRTLMEADDYSPSIRAWHELEVVNKTLEDFISKNKHGRLRRLFDTVSNDEKLACVKTASVSIKEILSTLTTPNKLDRPSLLTCKEALEHAIAVNAKLVSAAKLSASIGKTHKVLQNSLDRVNYAIKLMDEHNAYAKTKAIPEDNLYTRRFIFQHPAYSRRNQ